MLNVAFVAAVLPFTVSIRPEFFTAVRAGEIVVGFPIYHVLMLLPPVIAAGIAAEQFFLTLWLLLDFRTTVLAQHILYFSSGIPASVLPSPRRPWRRQKDLTVSNFIPVRSATFP